MRVGRRPGTRGPLVIPRHIVSKPHEWAAAWFCLTQARGGPVPLEQQQQHELGLFLGHHGHQSGGRGGQPSAGVRRYMRVRLLWCAFVLTVGRTE